MAYCKSMSCTVKALTCLLILLAISTTATTAARILDEAQQPAEPAVVAPPPEDSVPDPDTTVTTTATAPPPTVPLAPATAPAAAVVATTTPATDHHPLTFFMHDILGGSRASARIVTGIELNAGVNGQLPFAKPNGAVLPINGGGGVNLPTGGSGIINNINKNNNMIPFLTGLGGQTTTIANTNGNNIIGGNGLPFINVGQLPAGTTLQKLLFGTMTVIDDELSEGHELGSAVIGKAQGFYVASSEDGTSQTMAFTAMFESGHYIDSLSFFGVHRTVSDESQLVVIGGTGKYVNAKGYAVAKTLHSLQDQHVTDGVETVLEIAVYLSY